MIAQRLKQIIDFKGIKVSSFEREIGASEGTFRRAIKNNTDIQSKWLGLISENYPEINPLWLLTGKGSMTIENVKQEAKNVFKLRTDYNIDEQNIPLYNLEASAGLVDLFQNHADIKPIDTIHIPNLPKCDGAVFVTGDSMYPLLKSGDIVAYKEIQDWQNDIYWGEMYLISVQVGDEEFISVKYIQKSDEGNEYIKLVSQNQNHQPKDVPLKRVRAMAIVKASIRINSMR